MNTNLSSAQLKSISKGQLLGKYGSAISAQLAAEAIIFAASIICSALMDTTTTAGLVISFLVTFILDILSGIFTVGLTRFYLNLVCSRPYRVSDIFYGFRSHADRAIAIRFLVSAMQLLCMLPAFAALLLYINMGSASLFLLFSVLAVAGGILAVFIALSCSQVYYIMLDFPGYSVRQILSASRSIMKGHKGRLFYICVSMIPYYLLCLLSCGIALLWVTPYQQTLFTNFYLDLMHREYSV